MMIDPSGLQAQPGRWNNANIATSSCLASGTHCNGNKADKPISPPDCKCAVQLGSITRDYLWGGYTLEISTSAQFNKASSSKDGEEITLAPDGSAEVSDGHATFGFNSVGVVNEVQLASGGTFLKGVSLCGPSPYALGLCFSQDFHHKFAGGVEATGNISVSLQPTYGPPTGYNWARDALEDVTILAVAVAVVALPEVIPGVIAGGAASGLGGVGVLKLLTR